MGFRPLTGIKVSERQEEYQALSINAVSVPSRGLRYLNCLSTNQHCRTLSRFRPLTGIKVSELFKTILKRNLFHCFRPLTGIKVSELK